MTHGHELSGGIAGWKAVPGGGGQKGKKWDNYSSIINTIYLKKKAILLDCIVTAVISVCIKNTSKLVSFCVAILILKMEENIQHF